MNTKYSQMTQLCKEKILNTYAVDRIKKILVSLFSLIGYRLRIIKHTSCLMIHYTTWYLFEK